MENFHGTTILCVKRNRQVVMCGDGQVTLGHSIIKSSAKKVKKIYHNQIITGFAGSTADAFTLFERLESKLENFQGNLTKSAVELAKDWRSDKVLRRLEAMLIVADKHNMFLLNGNGDVLEPETDLFAIGSGGNYALASAKALYENTDLTAEQIAHKSLSIAADLCIYTNHTFTTEIISE